MGEARRRFLMTLAAAISCFVAMRGLAQEPKKKDSPAPDPPQPAETLNPAEAAAAAAKQGSQISKRALLLQNEKEFRAGVNRLHQLVGELKEELDRTVTTDVFSVQMYKKTEEIEKLAKQLKGKARGA
ncbi:MAG TPA: hypothetical protein VKH15_13440 [Candidatus Acidoferrum sp.]|jgi:mRNA-degrading endonuclease YafQ of YafQ-DinJ toxin-antitoxin module|nr:hypothetical protein [Candidatus Acidoferrum sp.]